MKCYAATIGFFDGVHLGHQFLLSRLREEASRCGLDAAVITFEEHPKVALTGVSPQLLTSFDERVSLLKEQCLDEIYAFRFDVVRDMTAAEFLRILHDQCAIRVLLMGYDHQFGSDSPHSPEQYRQLGLDVGIDILLMPQAPQGDVSSSKIRAALAAGRIEDANLWLGHPFTLSGKVVHGRGIGHTIHFPTANLLPTDPNHIVPAAGVYAVEVQLPDPDRWQPAVCNVGTCPTVDGNQLSIEVHVLDYEGDLYDRQLSVRFRSLLRGEQRFPSLSALQQQILVDVGTARNRLAQNL